VLACLWQAIAYGANDDKHAEGVFTALLVSSGFLLSFDVLTVVILASAIAIGLGTCFWQVTAHGANNGKQCHSRDGQSAGNTGLFHSSDQRAIIGVGAPLERTAVKWQVVLDLFKTKISCSQLSSRIYMKD